jgi:hypothetical protein
MLGVYIILGILLIRLFRLILRKCFRGKETEQDAAANP